MEEQREISGKARCGVLQKPDPATEDSGAGNAWMKQERSGVTISEESGKKPSLREVMRKNLVQEE